MPNTLHLMFVYTSFIESWKLRIELARDGFKLGSVVNGVCSSLVTVVWTTFYSSLGEGARRLFPYSSKTKVQRAESFTKSLASPRDPRCCRCAVPYCIVPSRGLAYLLQLALSVALKDMCRAGHRMSCLSFTRLYSHHGVAWHNLSWQLCCRLVDR
jgi:hypothetical protein